MRLSQKIATLLLYGLLVLCNWLFMLANDKVSHQSAYSLERLLLGLVTYAHVFTLMLSVSFDVLATGLPLVLLHVLVRNLLTFSMDMELADRGAVAWSVILVTPLYYSTITLLRPHWRLCVWIFFYTSACKLVAFNFDWRDASADAAVDALTGLVLSGLLRCAGTSHTILPDDKADVIDLDAVQQDSVATLVEADALDMRQVLANEVAGWHRVVTGYSRSV